MSRVRVIDSHTGGEPTRVVVEGGPDLGRGPIAERLTRFRTDYDAFRSAVVNEPRGSDVMVGALLLDPVDPSSAAAVLFFNNVGPLGMCGHGAIGLVKTLAHMGRIGPGKHHLETPVGTVTARLHEDGRVAIRNVPSYRHIKAATVEVPGVGPVRGDVAWGGNWFFLVSEHDRRLDYDRVDELTDYTWRIRKAVRESGITGRNGDEIDHVELFGPPQRPDADSRNFVLCPGRAYDRSPCGTGTSAKVACLYEDGKLEAGQIYRQESITGSLFEAVVEAVDGQILPTITGEAWVNAESTLLLDPADPLCWGLGGSAR